MQKSLVGKGPFTNYRLVSIQWQPFGFSQIKAGTEFDHAVYYLANEVVETNYNLQNFRGQLGGDGLIYGDRLKVAI